MRVKASTYHLAVHVFCHNYHEYLFNQCAQAEYLGRNILVLSERFAGTAKLHRFAFSLPIHVAMWQNAE